MNLPLPELSGYAGMEETRKKLRYAGVTAVFLPVGQGLIQILGLWFDDYTAASLLASAMIAFPMFFANKRFVWRFKSDENLRSQILVFWVAVTVGASLAALL